MKSAFVIAGAHSGVGKTTISIALMAALRRRGLTVQAFKVGPDFIDPGFHTIVTGSPSRNLDGWMLDRATNRQIFAKAMANADVAVVEGVMGLFDGASGTDEAGSTAEMAKWLNLPLILVIDAKAMARSAAAVVHGFETFDPDLKLAGVIANNIAGEKHFQYIKEAVSANCRAQLLGWLPRDEQIKLPSRHLGLVTAAEVLNDAHVSRLADWIEAQLDLSRLLEISTLNDDRETGQGTGSTSAADKHEAGAGSDLRIGVAQDLAFCFYYQENLDLLRSLGAELVFWSPMNDPLPTGLHGLYFGGGYPEIQAAQLSANEAAHRAVASFVAAGGSVYAECGGLMYLTEAIVHPDGATFPMAGVFPTRARMRERLTALGYVEVEGSGEGAAASLLQVGENARGHQFRYSEIDPMPANIARRYRLFIRRSGDEPTLEGYVVNQCLASYVHLHFLSNPRFPARWLASCRRTGITT